MVKETRPLFRKIEVYDVENVIKESMKYLKSKVFEGDYGLFVANNQEDDQKLGFYSGESGILYFFIEYAKYFDDSETLGLIEKLGDKFLKYIEIKGLDEDIGLRGLNFENASLTFENGYSGYAYILYEIYRLTRKDRFKEMSLRIIKKIISSIVVNEDKMSWTGQLTMLGDGNIILFITHLFDVLDERDIEKLELNEIVEGITEFALSKVTSINDNQVKINMIDFPILKSFFRLDSDNSNIEYPNFNMGTSGGAYIFTKLYEITGNKNLLSAARKSVNYLRDIAVEVKPNSCLMPFRIPDMTNLYYLGYCHGVVGTSLVLHNLYKITNDERYLGFYRELSQGLIDTGAPFIHSPGYWRTYNQCCGTAGMLEMFINAYNLTQDQKDYDHAYDAMKKILSEASIGEDGVYWVQAWGRIRPNSTSVDLGFMNGLAGISSSLIHYCLASNKEHREFYLPRDIKTN